MKQVALNNPLSLNNSIPAHYLKYAPAFMAGLLGPLGFAPFHMPGLLLLSIAFLLTQLLNAPTTKKSVLVGFNYGLGYFGFGVSWVILSIHDYGEINYFLSALATLLFIIYLALFPALVAYGFKKLQSKQSALFSLISFSVLWCFSEYLRAHFLTGFPWILVGTALIDTPLKYLAPLVGLYGLSFIAVFCASLLAFAFQNSMKRTYYLIAFVLLLITPSLLKPIAWTTVSKQPISVGAVQANLAMRDKWDEQLFWNLLNYYEKNIDKLLGKQLIILPESAIPLPQRYLEEYLNRLHEKALKAKSALMVGILQPVDENESHFYNSIISLGQATGQHDKYQLVPFGEYIPKPFAKLFTWFNLPDATILPGKKIQPLVKIANHPIASLICYEIAYPHLVRQQMPESHWIVSISDNGWFGQSLASYQQLQMSQMLSLLTGRYQVVVNNDGLSSIINTKGDILEGLKPFTSGLLQGEIFQAQGATPWVILGDYPIFIFGTLCLFIMIYFRFKSDLK